MKPWKTRIFHLGSDLFEVIQLSYYHLQWNP